VNLAVHFIRVSSSLILSCSSGPFSLYYAVCWSGGGEKKNCGGDCGRGKGGGKMEEIDRYSKTGRMVFHTLFML